MWREGTSIHDTERIQDQVGDLHSLVKEVTIRRTTRPYCAINLKTEVFHSENVLNVFLPHHTGGILNATIAGHFGFVFKENPFREKKNVKMYEAFQDQCKQATISKHSNKHN